MKKTYKMLLLCSILGLAITGFKNKPVVAVNETNPFFTAYATPFEVPPFEKIMAKHYMPAFIKGMSDGKIEIENIAKSNKYLSSYHL